MFDVLYVIGLFFAEKKNRNKWTFSGSDFYLIFFKGSNIYFDTI